MLSKISIIIFLCFIAYASSQTITKLTYTDCGSKNVQISRLSLTPMPIVQPGKGTLSFAIAASEPIQGVIKMTLDIVRKVSGIPLPVRCYIVQGEQVGSCTYPDMCALMQRLFKHDATNCPAQLSPYGIDCTCPVKVNKNDLDIEMDLDIPEAPEYASWLSVGDFYVKVKATVVFLLFSSSWSYVVDEHDGKWSWINAKYLTRSNWTSSLKANNNASKIHHPVWFIYHYLSYCGFCKRYKPQWESIAQYAAGWSRYIKIGAYDCGSESASEHDICVDEAYPQWRIYCPLTNSTQLAFDSERRNADTKPEDILMWSIKKMNKIAHQCYGKTWPIRNVIEPKNIDDLNNIIPKRVKQFQLFVSDDILLYSLYVLNNSKIVFQEPIYRLSTKNLITQGIGIWKGMKNPDGRISLEQINSTKTTDKFILNKNIISHTNKSIEKKIGSLKPTLTDIDSSVVWMIKKDLHRKLPNLFDDVKAWLNVVHTYYPGSDTMHNFLRDLIHFMNNRTTLSSNELKNYIDTISVIKLPEVKFDHCNGSDTSKRGYTCSLWLLFHSMIVKQAILHEQNLLPSNVKPSDMILSIREYVRRFFLCDECAKHFLNMTSNAENEINSFKENVLYLWRGHNKVNKRLRGEQISNDPAWPKVPFPTKEQCNSCVREIDENNDALEYDENETYNYLKDYYDLQNITNQKNLSTKTNTATNRQYNHLLLFLFTFFIIN
ncbi:unnamed protein product [Rotaria sordida]|uniref:Sulfhydryl oxidase n=1 Tax=Rotaria sordida TaxID=392033 RepID=A0A813Y4R3_9BILA|nr:unnamed protein product [Rotaria sordida]